MSILWCEAQRDVESPKHANRAGRVLTADDNHSVIILGLKYSIPFSALMRWLYQYKWLVNVHSICYSGVLLRC